MLITLKNIRAPGKLLCLLLMAAVCFSGCKPKPEEQPAEKPATPVVPAAEVKQSVAEKLSEVVTEAVEKVFPLTFENNTWSGKGLLDGEAVTIQVIDQTGEGKPLDFSRRAYMAIGKGTPRSRNLAYVPLSKVVFIDGAFYSVSIDSNTVKLEEYSGPKGTIQVEFDSPGIVSTDVGSLYLIGKDDKTITYNVSTEKSKKLAIPAMSYTAANLSLILKDKEGTEWTAVVVPEKDAAIVVSPDKPAALKIAVPGITVTAVDETKRQKPPKTQQTAYARGAKIFLNASLENEAGQKYSRINKGTKGVTPELKVLDPSGKEIAAKTMEYG